MLVLEQGRAEQRGPPRGQDVCLVVGLLTSAIKHNLLAWTGENSCYAVHSENSCCAVRAGSRRAPDVAGSLRRRRAKTHRRGKAQSEYKQIPFPLWTGQ